jgi:hypothetical protein
MTTEPLKEPLSQRGTLYSKDRFLANVKCLLTPTDVPVRGIAEVPNGVDWLSFGTLTLALRNGRRYTISPAKLQRADDAPTLLKFFVRT